MFISIKLIKDEEVCGQIFLEMLKEKRYTYKYLFRNGPLQSGSYCTLIVSILYFLMGQRNIQLHIVYFVGILSMCILIKRPLRYVEGRPIFFSVYQCSESIILSIYLPILSKYLFNLLFIYFAVYLLVSLFINIFIYNMRSWKGCVYVYKGTLK